MLYINKYVISPVGMPKTVNINSTSIMSESIYFIEVNNERTMPNVFKKGITMTLTLLYIADSNQISQFHSEVHLRVARLCNAQQCKFRKSSIRYLCHASLMSGLNASLRTDRFDLCIPAFVV